MKTIEEQLWNYIDGDCNISEKIEIEAKIAANLEYNAIYQELLEVHNELNKINIEEPSMSFTRNVMEQINLELKPISLKTKVDNRIIYTISSFFILSIVVIFGYTIANSHFSFDFKLPSMNFDMSKFINASTIQIFLLVDMVLCLLYLDSFLRKRKDNTQKKGA